MAPLDKGCTLEATGVAPHRPARPLVAAGESAAKKKEMAMEMPPGIVQEWVLQFGLEPGEDRPRFIARILHRQRHSFDEVERWRGNGPRISSGELQDILSTFDLHVSQGVITAVQAQLELPLS